MTPFNLRTEYLVDPLGLDEPRPHLSWALRGGSAPGPDDRQAAYHLQVASTPEKCGSDRADIWDSGTVESADTAHVAYAGPKLVSRQQCHWAVRVQDARGRWSEWSPPAHFTMGLLEDQPWSAPWIGTGESFTCDVDLNTIDKITPPDNTMADPWFRRSLRLTTQPVRATAFVASVGYHELFVNGQRVGDAVLSPSVTDNSQRARYVAYEIAGLLHAGENVIGLWLGTGWSIFPVFTTPDKPRAPIVSAQFDFDFADGKTQRFVTDRTWRTHPSCSSLLGMWYFMNFGGERIDGAREQPDWAKPGASDADWRDAVEFQPQIKVSADKTEPNRLMLELQPVAVTEPTPGEYRVDFGRNFAGWTEVKIAGEPGDTVEMLFSEREHEAITNRLHNTYIVGPSGHGVFRNRFNYSSGRWMLIRGVRRPPAPGDIRGWLVRNDFSSAASFECSHPLFNRIHETTRWTLENLMLGGYIVDCPQRERMGYGGDGHATITTALSLFHVGAFYTKWAEDWRDVEGRAPIWGHERPPTMAGGGAKEEGNLPYTAPTYWGGGGPIWSGFCVHLPWEVYRRYGDTTILRANYDMMRSWLGFLEGKARNNLLERWGGEWDFLGDWLWPEAAGVNGDTRETLFLNNCYWIYNLQLCTQIARILGHEADAATWDERARVIRRSVHAEFYNPADHSYVNGFQAKLAIALLADVPPPELRAAVWQRLEHEILVVRRGHIHAGITGGAMLFKTLLDAGRDDLIYAMVNKEEFPSWGFMLREGATTIWEAWSNSESLLHSSFIYVGAWFTNGVLGIRPHPEVPGFREFVVRPGLVAPPVLTSACGHYDSIAGRIEVDWQWRDGRFELKVAVPPNTRAHVHLQTSNPASVRENGQAIVDSPRLRAAGTRNGRTIIEAGPGEYHFSCELRLPASTDSG